MLLRDRFESPNCSALSALRKLTARSTKYLSGIWEWRREKGKDERKGKEAEEEKSRRNDLRQIPGYASGSAGPVSSQNCCGPVIFVVSSFQRERAIVIRWHT